MKILVGSYTSEGGPGVTMLEASENHLSVICSCRAVDNPCYLCLSEDKTTLYATATIGANKKGAIAAFRVGNNSLTPVSIQPAASESCHLTLNEDEDYLYTAMYHAGNVCVFPVHDGYILPSEQLIHHRGGTGVVPDRQEAAHVHQCMFRPETNELFVCDLGKDEVFVYTCGDESGLLVHTSSIQVPAGSGPRHLLFVGKDRFLLGNELGNTVMNYECRNGEWTLVQTLSTLPENCAVESAVAAVKGFGDRIFVSNRGHDSVAIYRLENGLMSLEDIWKIRGCFPRDILPLSETDVLCANQISGSVEWLQNGKTVAEVALGASVCLLKL